MADEPNRWRVTKSKTGRGWVVRGPGWDPHRFFRAESFQHAWQIVEKEARR